MTRAPLALCLALSAAPAFAQELKRERLTYATRGTQALTVEVVTPAKPNGLGAVWVLSSGWNSSADMAKGHARYFDRLAERGYTVFAAAHRSQPAFSIADAAEDVHAAVGFVRANAQRFGVDPDRLGACGASAGGHLALLLGTTGRPADPKASDTAARAGSRVAAVGCFYPPTDFTAWPGLPVPKGVDAVPAVLRAPFRFCDTDPQTGTRTVVRDEGRFRDIVTAISPARHADAGDAPALIIQGTTDLLVPMQQAERMRDALEAAKVPVKLIVRDGLGHGWRDVRPDMTAIGEWFDKHLGR